MVFKLLLPELADDPTWLARFEREARLLGEVRSNHVATLLGSGRAGERPYLAYASRDGETLASRLASRSTLSVDELSPIVRDCLYGLIAAHDAGVIHRDVKPDNVFLERTAEGGERAVLIDFGVARAADDMGLTSAHATVGTLAFMAPEQYEASRKLDGRVDVYALGTLMFLALTGRLPFESRTLDGLVALKLERDPPTLAEVTGEDFPPALERFLRRALARQPSRRIPSATEALRAWRAASTETSPRVQVATTPKSDDEPATLANPRPRRSWQK